MNDLMRVPSVSSGLGSAYAWSILAERHGSDALTAVFTDVNGEHPDNYRFLAETTYAIGSRCVKITNGGRTIWDVMVEQRFLANTRVDICSRVLKREAMLGWLKEHCDPANTIISLGIDWTEEHRFLRARDRWAKDGWTVDAPLCEAPYRLKTDAEAWLAGLGIARPKLYDLGFSHANCGGGCVKAGIAQFTLLLSVDRAWYVGWWENGEEYVRRVLGRDDVAILRDRSHAGIMRYCGLSEREVATRSVRVGTDDFGEPLWRSEWYVLATGAAIPTMVPVTLRGLRERLDGGGQLSLDEQSEWGACGCFTDGDDEVPVSIEVAS